MIKHMITVLSMLLSVSTASAATGPLKTFSTNFGTTLDSHFSFTRATNAWDFDNTGAIVSFSSNVAMRPIMDGIGIWGARTNLISSPSSPTTGTITSGATQSYYTGWLRGSGSIAISGSASCTITESSPCNFYLGSSQSATYTTSGTVSFAQIERTGSNSTTYRNPSPPILTGNYTRAADNLSIPLTQIGQNGTSGSLAFRVKLPAYSSAQQTIFQVNDGANSNYFACYVSTTLQRPTCAEFVGGVLTKSVITDAVTINDWHDYAFSYDATQMCMSVDHAESICATVDPIGVTLTTLQIGNTQAVSTQALMGYVKSMEAWNDSVNPGLLQTLLADVSFPNIVMLGGMGQSNMYGSYAAPILTKTAPYPTQLLMANDAWNTRGCATTNCVNINPQYTGLTPAFEMFSPLPTCSGTGADANCGESPMTAFGQEAINRGVTNSLLVRNFSAPGHTIAEISKGQSPYTNFTTFVAKTKTQATTAGKSVSFGMMAFNNQQTDALAGTDPSTYCSGVQTLQSDASSDFGSNIPFAIAQFSTFANGVGYYTAQCVADFILANPTKFYAAMPTYTLPHNATHGPHFTNSAQILQGRYFGKCYADSLGPGCKNMMVTAASLSGNVITLTLRVPTAPIVLGSTTNVPQGLADNYGLTYVDDTMSARISSVSVVDSSHIAVSLNTTPTGGHPYIIGGMTGEPGVNADQRTQTTNNRTPLAISNAGTGGAPGICTVTLALDTANAREQAQYSVVIGSTGSISDFNGTNPVIRRGRYSAALLLANQDNVPVTGCGLVGATLSGVNLVMQPDGKANDSALPTLSAWDGISNGVCELTLNLTGATQNPSYTVSVTSGVPTITKVSTYGNYPVALFVSSYSAAFNNVPVQSGGSCGATNAKASSVKIVQSLVSNTNAGSWMNIQDSTSTLPNLLWAFAKAL